MDDSEKDTRLTVGKLIEQLSKFDPNTIPVLSHFGGIGPRSIGIQRVDVGFDWDHGKAMLIPTICVIDYESFRKKSRECSALRRGERKQE